MKLFHISDVLSVTTGILVSYRHIDGVYEILNFLTGDDLFTHQLRRARDECKPWLRAMFPNLMEDSSGMPERLSDLDYRIKAAINPKEEAQSICKQWVEELRISFGLPEMLPVYEMGSEMHTHINPIEEAQAMTGDNRVITVEVE